MYTGTMLDNLIASVQKAEEHAAVIADHRMPVQVELYARTHEFNYDNEALLGVA
ncbi:MAG: hypothetical protein HYX28_06225 [Candidatus Koribacter versatilis]|uniref:Uncharacterized protein n=1 Tax=Candidatus Korobacter versatilis TaxID=658062 RepID=A0A932EPP2_9BACT|nr:hypothetical protein [Candidatus Koribacter versatilis]